MHHTKSPQAYQPREITGSLAARRVPKILALPDELLLKVALQVGYRTGEIEGASDGLYEIPFRVARKVGYKTFDIEAVADGQGLISTRNLKNLSLTCKRLRPIVREILVGYAAIAESSIWKFVQFLLQYPELIKSVKHIHLGMSSGSGGQVRYESTTLVREVFAAHANQLAESLGLPSNKPVDEPTERGLAADPLSVALALCSNLEGTTVPLGIAYSSIILKRLLNHDSSFFRAGSLREWQITLPSLLKDKLTTLNILDDGKKLWKVRATLGPSGLSQFRKLKSVSVPFVALACQDVHPHIPASQTTIPHPTTVLPSSLERVTLYTRNLDEHRLFLWIDQIITSYDTFDGLRQLQLCVTSTLAHVLNNMECLHGYRFSSVTVDEVAEQLRLSRSWEVSSVGFETYFLSLKKQDSLALPIYDRVDWAVELKEHLWSEDCRGSNHYKQWRRKRAIRLQERLVMEGLAEP